MRAVTAILPAVLALPAGCRAAPPATPASAAPASAAPANTAPPSAAPNSAAPATHPGQITFVKADGSESTRPAAQVPESIAWATLDGQRVPVVRVVQHRAGPADAPLRVEIVRYAADGRELDRTVSAPRRR